MRAPQRNTSRGFQKDTAMTPMIDVVFLLLIFFVCASLGQKPEFLLSTPLSGTIENTETHPEEIPPPVDDVWVELSWQGERTVVHLNDRELTNFEQVLSTLHGLAEIAPETPVILDVGPDVPMRDVIRTYDTCRAARYESVSFATSAPDETQDSRQPDAE